MQNDGMLYDYFTFKNESIKKQKIIIINHIHLILMLTMYGIIYEQYMLKNENICRHVSVSLLQPLLIHEERILHTQIEQGSLLTTKYSHLKRKEH